MSARAAWRLEELGFTRVYDYHAGRRDWEAAALPVEGTDERGSIVADAIAHDPPTAGLDDTVGEARRRLGDGTQVIVTAADSVVVGVLRKESWDAADDKLVAEAMRSGPATVRPGSQLTSLVERLEKKDIESVIVTDAEGRLIGILETEAGRRSLSGEVAETFETCDSCPGWWRHRRR